MTQTAVIQIKPKMCYVLLLSKAAFIIKLASCFVPGAMHYICAALCPAVFYKTGMKKWEEEEQKQP